MTGAHVDIAALLAAIIDKHVDVFEYGGGVEGDVVADEILAKFHVTERRELTTVEELAALPDAAVIRSVDGPHFVSEKYDGVWLGTGNDFHMSPGALLPCTVVWVP